MSIGAEQEKETDARITIEMLLDAQDGEVDELWLMSRDADLVPVIDKIRERYQLKMLIALPPNGSDDQAGGDTLVA